MTKKCANCGGSGPFNNDKSKRDGLSSWCKACVNEKSRAWRLENPDRAREHLRKWRAKNPDRQREHKVKWRDKNRAQANASVSRWAKANPEKRRVYTKNRRNNKLGASGKFSSEEWGALCRKYDNRCLACGKKTRLTVDHVVPISVGGSNDISNIQPLCVSCNSRKGTKVIDYRTKSGILRWIQRKLF